MPCTDPFAEEQSRRETVTNLHERTRMLCGLCREIERKFNVLESGDIFHKVPGLPQWWAQHQKEDERRRKEEDIARQREIIDKQKEVLRLQNEIAKLREKS